VTTSIRPLPGPPREYHFPSFERHTLTNGLRIIVAPVQKLPVVTVLAVIEAGASNDPRGLEGLAHLTAEALREGTVSHTGLELLEGFENLGSSLESGADWDSTVVSMTLLKDQLRSGYALFAEVLTSPSFPEHEVERLKAERLAERLQILAEPRGLADESFSKFLYAENSRYGEPMNGNNESISRVTRQSVADFFGSRYTPDATTLIIVGDIGFPEGVELVTAALGGWQGRKLAGATAVVQETRSVRAMEVVSKADAAQAELRIGHKGVARSHPDYFKLVVMNAVLGGLFSSRINLNLREKHGYTYSASSYYDWRRQPGPFVIATAVQSEVVADALRETLAEIDGMRKDAITVDELSLATSYLEGVFPIRYETTSAIASALANLVIFDLPDTFYDGYRENIRNVSTADVLRAAQAYVRPEELRVVVVGDPAVVKTPLENLKFSSVSVQAPTEA
jgi:zinc protease